MIFIAIDHDFKNISVIPKILKEQKIIIRDTPIDNEVRTSLLKAGKILIQITLDNKTQDQRIDTILKIAKNIYVFVNDINTSENRFFLKFENTVVFNQNMEKMSFLKNDFQNEKLIENYDVGKKENSVKHIVENRIEKPIVCNVAIKKKPLPRRIKVIE